MDSTKQTINILTWNATGIMSSAIYLCNCLYNYKIDICGISEHWLYEKDLRFLNQIDNSYISHAAADFDLKRPSSRRVGKGGVAILWHRKYDRFISRLALDDDRIVGIKYEIDTSSCIYFFQVYLPCVNHSIDVFREYIDRLQNLLSLYSEKGTVVIMGDFNTYLPDVNLRDRVDNRSLYFNSFLRDNNMFSTNTSELCNGPKSTFVTYDGRHESLIDYILVPIEKSRKVLHCEIIHDSALNVSRHRPVYCTLELPTCVAEAAPSDNESNINWKKVDQACINNYQNILQNSEHMINIIHRDLETPGSIDQAYTVLVTEVIAAAQKCLPKKSFKHFLKPYWNQELTDLHKKMKLYRSAWIKYGKPRQPNQTTYTDYKRAKRCFRQCHRKHVHAYLQGQIEEIDRLAEVDSAHFWRLVKARRKESNSSPGSEMIFEGRTANSAKEINIGWGQYFKKLYTPTQRDHFDNQSLTM